MERRELLTRKDVLAAIRKARAVYVAPRFGASEYEVQISKAEAKRFICCVLREDATPEECDMYAGYFGTVTEHGDVILG